MSTPGYALDPEQLRTHAGNLAGYADRLSAIGTGLPDSMAEQSLGSFTQFLTAGLSGAMTETLNAFGHVASTLDTVAGGLGQTVDTYQRADEDSATTLVGIETGTGEEVR